jgi:transposase
MIKLGEVVIPIVNLLNDHLLDGPLLHRDETTLQVLRSHEAPSSDHFMWVLMWVRAGSLPERKVVLFDYRGRAAPKLPSVCSWASTAFC